MTDSGDPAVAALSELGLYSFCTASLISKHTLLTAGHCNITGAEAEFGDVSIDVAMTVVHPMSTGEGKPYDLALMKLAKDPVGVTPLALAGTAPAVGAMIRHVGFGVTDDGTGEGGGVKRTVTYPINKVDGMLVYSGAPGMQTCSGDSGGPGLVGGAIAAVVSDGPDCQLSQDGWDNRVDLVRDWIVATTSGWDVPPTFDDGSGSGSDGSGSDGGGSDGGGTGSSSGGCATGGDASAGGLLLVVVLLIAIRRRTRA